ncbi:MAG: LacI family DNA-binding transcriptional regulator [Victivallales bacterium]|nr:LacI family DNA-binding transcriptional regulator [Victivallales bacterium]
MIGLKDIALEVGVSKATVSLVLNNGNVHGRMISPEVSARVRAAAERLGYVPNEMVRSMIKGKSHTIALLASFDPFMLPIIQGYSDMAAEHGYSLRLISVGNDVNAALRKALEYRAEGIAALSLDPQLRRTISPDFYQRDIPTLGLSQETRQGNPFFDQTGSAALAVDYLAGLGHRRIVCRHTTSEIAKQRLDGYRQAMARHGLAPLEILEDDGVSPLLSLLPDAVFCTSDRLALQLMQELYARRRFVPEAFSIMGFGNTDAAELSSPSLTTVNEPYYETGCDCCLSLLHHIKCGEPLDLPKRLGTIIQRNSTTNK